MFISNTAEFKCELYFNDNRLYTVSLYINKLTLQLTAKALSCQLRLSKFHHFKYFQKAIKFHVCTKIGHPNTEV